MLQALVVGVPRAARYGKPEMPEALLAMQIADRMSPWLIMCCAEPCIVPRSQAYNKMKMLWR